MKERGGRHAAWMRPWPGVREDGGKTEVVIVQMGWRRGSWTAAMGADETPLWDSVVEGGKERREEEQTGTTRICIAQGGADKICGLGGLGTARAGACTNTDTGSEYRMDIEDIQDAGYRMDIQDIQDAGYRAHMCSGGGRRRGRRHEPQSFSRSNPHFSNSKTKCPVAAEVNILHMHCMHTVHTVHMGLHTMHM